MVYDLDKGAHSVYSLYYHFIQVVKYRKKVFANDAIVDLLKTKTREIAHTFDVDILEIECDKDHFHMLFKASPQLNIPQFINAVKTITSREIQRNFPDVKKELRKGKFWSPSYFLATSGQVTLGVLKGYVDSQEVKRNENL
ncbi:MAG: IS200/IS605 family transposase [Candidatus Thermoplasmatota archaeon]|nr:IS200/IS605 family transposase [Candidatus Thermoplasmatota archaeon]